jgi:hypothetical protein
MPCYLLCYNSLVISVQCVSLLVIYVSSVNHFSANRLCGSQKDRRRKFTNESPVGTKRVRAAKQETEARLHSSNGANLVQAEHWRHQEKLLAQLHIPCEMAMATSELRISQRAAKLAQKVKVVATST